MRMEWNKGLKRITLQQQREGVVSAHVDAIMHGRPLRDGGGGSLGPGIQVFGPLSVSGGPCSGPGAALAATASGPGAAALRLAVRVTAEPPFKLPPPRRSRQGEVTQMWIMIEIYGINASRPQ